MQETKRKTEDAVRINKYLSPHHVANISTNTGTSLFNTSSSKLSLVNVYSIIIHLSFAIYLNIVLLRLVTEKIDRPICSYMDANIETTGSCIETFLVS